MSFSGESHMFCGMQIKIKSESEAHLYEMIKTEWYYQIEWHTCCRGSWNACVPTDMSLSKAGNLETCSFWNPRAQWQ